MDTLFILAAKYLFIVPVIILALYFLRRPRSSWMRLALFAVPAAILTLVLGKIANHLYFDPRPFVVGHFTPLIPHAADNGFPSDHTLLVAAVAMIGTIWNRRLGAVLWILAILVGIARVYVGIHHATDIIGSMAIAIVAVLITYAVWKRFVQSNPSY